jgi:hypothetical protein
MDGWSNKIWILWLSIFVEAWTFGILKLWRWLVTQVLKAETNRRFYLYLENNKIIPTVISLKNSEHQTHSILKAPVLNFNCLSLVVKFETFMYCDKFYIELNLIWIFEEIWIEKSLNKFLRKRDLINLSQRDATDQLNIIIKVTKH